MREPYYVQGGEGRSDQEIEERGQMALAAYVVIAPIVAVAFIAYLLFR